MAKNATFLLCIALSLAACRSRIGRNGSPPDEVDVLRALGYFDVVEDAPAGLPVGLLQRDQARAAPGLTYLTWRTAHRWRST